MNTPNCKTISPEEIGGMRIVEELKDAKEIRLTYDESEVNELLADGWKCIGFRCEYEFLLVRYAEPKQAEPAKV